MIATTLRIETDEQLVERAQAGESAAFDELARR